MKDLEIALPNRFFSEEIRSGYLVTAEQKRIWAVELDLLNKLLSVCQKRDIEVFVDCGTLLGTIRHKGFIPWDDDIDVCMTRPNFEKLISIADDEFKEPYFLQHALNDRKYFCPYARLRNSSTTGIIKGQESVNYNNGIYIDVFVRDGFVDDEKKRKKQMRQRGWVLFCLDQNLPLQKWKAIVFLFLRKAIGKMVSYEKLVDRYGKVISRYNEEAEKLTLMTHSEKFQITYQIHKKDLMEKEYLPFETLMVPVPKNYKRVLTDIYGDYMKFPPEEERGQWHADTLFFNADISYKETLKGIGE